MSSGKKSEGGKNRETASTPPRSGGTNGGSSRTSSQSTASIHSHRSTTTTRIVRGENGVSIHSTHSTHSSVEMVTSAADADILSIQSTLEEVAASQNSPETTRTRAGFNSVSDALGNLRSRLSQAHEQLHRSSERGNLRGSSSPSAGGGSANASSANAASANARGSWLRRLSDRLRVVDAAHSSRAPLHVVEGRRTHPAVSTRIAEGKADDDDEGAGTRSRPGSAQSAPPLHAAATIFRVDVRETTTTTTASRDRSPERSADDGRPSLQQRNRSSVVFSSRVVASRSIMQGTQSATTVLLASGGDGAGTSRRDLLGASSARGSGGSLRDFEMHLHPSVSCRMLSPIADRTSSGDAASTSTAASAEDVDHPMEAEPTEDAVVRDVGNELYSWGKGDRTLHDESDDRILASSRGREPNAARATRVASRLESKSILAVATGPHHSACATSRGSLYVVGKNVRGCVDPNAEEGTVRSRPALLDCISHVRVVQVSCGYDHTAVISSNGSVLTWGSNVHGQLGHRSNGNHKLQSEDYQGPTNCRPTGMALGMGRRASSVACGTYYTLVLTQHMSLLACGIPSIAGHRDAASGKWGMPEEIPSLVGLPLVQMSAGDGHAAVVTAHGTAFVWGENRNGCCARDFPKTLSLPVPVKAPSSQGNSNAQSMLSDDVAISHVACGLEHSVFVTRGGNLLVCGANYQGQLCIDASKLKATSKVVSVEHPNNARFVSVEAGNGHTLVLDSVGDLWATDTNGLHCVLEGRSVLAIAAGGDCSCSAIASTPSGSKTLQRQFSVEMPEDTSSIVDSVDALLGEMESDGICKSDASREIAKKSEELLRHPSVMNLILNPRKLEAMFERILCSGDLASRQTIANSIERGIKLGLESLRGSRMMYPEAVRCLLSYIKFFDIRRDDEIVFDVRGEAIFLFCDTMLSIPFEGYRALHDFATNIYPRALFVKMLVRPLLLTLNACTKTTVDDNEVQHFSPSRQAVPVIVAVLSWLYAMGVEEGNLADPTDFYSDGVSDIDTEILFEDLCRMKKASPSEKSKNFYLCAHPFLLSPGCKRNLLQMESQVEMFKAMMGDVNFNTSMSQIKVDPFYHLEIERDHLVEQTLDRIKQSEPKEIRKRLRVSFKGEEGVDAGGVTKEFFQLLCEELFDTHSGLWSNKYGDEINWFNADNTWDDKGFELIGVLFGLALYNSVLLDVRFPIAVYRKILGLPLGLEDIMDEELRRGLKQLLDYEGDDVEDIFCLSFEVTWSEMGEEKRLELKPDGANIAVNNQNREEYVLRYVRWVLVDSIQPQWDSFQTGVMRVMEDSSLDLFLPEELELLVVGSPELDFSALQKNTQYEGGYDENSEVVKNFWRFVKEASPEAQVKLLKFATASTMAPIGGLGKLDFLIQRAGPDSQNLPTSHTCFNTLLLPDYGSDYEKLKHLLGRAILECEGFGLE